MTVGIKKAETLRDCSQYPMDRVTSERNKLIVNKTSGKSFWLPSGGATCAIVYNPQFNSTADANGLITPPFIVLAHELIHALHCPSGDRPKNMNYQENSPNATWKHEEAWTVDMSIYRHGRISENAIRREQGLAERTEYMPGETFAGLTTYEDRANMRKAFRAGKV